MRVRPAVRSDLAKLASCDYSFPITEVALGPFDREKVSDRTIDVPPHRKTYDFSSEALGGHLERPEHQLFVAEEIVGQPVGYAAASVAWNRFVSVDDLAIDAANRRAGAGRRLMDIVVAWADRMKAPGLRLETQANNVAACRFYESYGFVLGGHDRHLYAGMVANAHEVALFWYFFFGAPIEMNGGPADHARDSSPSG